jgi:hypothetical protein
MAEYQILRSEPRHRIDDFVDELLARAREVIADLGPALERLLRDMVAQFQTFRERHYLITLRDVRFEWVRWTPDGRLVIEFSADPTLPRKPDPPELRHVVIDAFADGVVGRTVPEDLRGEFRQFLRGLVHQFAALKKHAPVDLPLIAFDRVEWLTDRRLAIRMTHRGRPFLPQDVGWG